MLNGQLQGEGGVAAKRFSPSSFDPRDPALSARERTAPRWDSCERALRRFNARFLLSRLPLFWQVEALLDDACRKAGVTVFHNEVENMPVAGAAIRTAEIDTVITTGEDAHALVAYLFEKTIPIPKNWFLIHPKSRRDIPRKLQESAFHIIEEVHEYPGSPYV